MCCSCLAALMPHFALLKVHLSTKGAALGPTPGRSPRSPAARHLCTGQILATAVTMKGSVKEASPGGDREVGNEGREADSEKGRWISRVALQ